MKRILYALGILTDRRKSPRVQASTCDRLSYLARTSHY